MAAERYRPHVEVRIPSPNYSARQGGAFPTLIVVHATAGHNRPGVVDLQGLGSYFAQPAVKVSSHVATDNEGNSGRFVPDKYKAWHVAAYNSLSLGIEQVIPGDGTEVTEDLYRETARWIAYWHHQHGIPIRQGAVEGLHVTRSGVVRHSELGVLGGNHSDPGQYDEHHVLALARGFAKRY